MPVKLHRCSATWAKGPHPCWRAQRALNEAGIDYQLVLHPAFPRGRRRELEQLTGSRMLPVVEFEDGSLLRQSQVIAERARSGRLEPDSPAAA
jgi:glutathione S-transferase